MQTMRLKPHVLEVYFDPGFGPEKPEGNRGWRQLKHEWQGHGGWAKI